MAESEDAFWDFTLRFYGGPGVSPACIALQDRHRCDVNLVLYACWIGLSGRGRLSEADFARAEAANTPWRSSVIEPMRAARRALKVEAQSGAEKQLYEAVKAAELGAERVAQQRLRRLAPATPFRAAAERAGDAAANLALYLGGRGAEEAAPIFAAIRAAEG